MSKCRERDSVADVMEAVATEARHRFVVRLAGRPTKTRDLRAAQSAVAAALCRRTP